MPKHFRLIFVWVLLAIYCDRVMAQHNELPSLWIGYNEHRTNLPGGRHANCSTNRAMLVRADGSQRRQIASDLANEVGAWTQFAGWSPDGKSAIIGRGWESEENAKWEEEHKTFRFTSTGWLYDSYLVDIVSGRSET